MAAEGGGEGQPRPTGMPPACNCCPTAVDRQVKKDGPNKGRWFYACPKYPGCKFFSWAAGPSFGAPRRRQSGAGARGGGEGGIVEVHLQMVSEDRMGAYCQSDPEWSVRLEAAYRSLPASLGARWDAEVRMWTFQAAAHQHLVHTLEGMGPVVVREVPADVRAALDAPAPVPAEEASIRFDALPTATMERLLPFQREGVRWGLLQGGRCLVADDMGLGKTVQGIALAACYPEDWPLLVICPTSLRAGWKAAIEEWLPGTAAAVVASGADAQRYEPPASGERRATIVSYELVQKLAGATDYRVVVADESHLLKSTGAARTQFVVPLLQRARRAVLLSGTPALSRPVELFPQLDALRPGLLGTFARYGARYCAPRPGRFGAGIDYSGSSHTAELRAVLQHCFMIRRLKGDVLSELPPKVRGQVWLDLTPAELAPVEGIREVMAALPQGAEGQAERQALLGELRAVSAGAKLRAAAEHVRGLLARSGGDKVLVFAHHKRMVQGLVASLAGASVAHIVITGDTPASQREELVGRFQRDTAYRAAVLSITAAGVGITLTAARLVVFAELDWVPGNLIQAEDRAHRIGQDGSVTVHYCLAKGTVDDLIWPTVQRKLSVVGRTLEGEGRTGTRVALAITAEEQPVVSPLRSSLGTAGNGATPSPRAGGRSHGGSRQASLGDLWGGASPRGRRVPVAGSAAAAAAAAVGEGGSSAAAPINLVVLSDDDGEEEEEGEGGRSVGARAGSGGGEDGGDEDDRQVKRWRRERWASDGSAR